MPQVAPRYSREKIASFDANNRLAPEERLKGLEQRFNVLVNAVEDYAIFILDKFGRVATWNSGAQRIKGYRADEILGQHFSVFYPQAAKDANHPAYELAVASEKDRYEEEGIRLRKDGSEFWAHVTITALRDENGEVTGFLKITRDITERKLAEKKLRDSEERWRLLLGAVRDYAIFLLDAEGHVASWNLGAQSILGYASEEIIGQSFTKFYPQEALLRKHPQKELEIARELGRYEEEGIRVRKDGSHFWSSVIITALYHDDGSLRGFAKVTRDVTERKRAEEEIRKVNEELEMRVRQRTQELQETVAKRDVEIAERIRIEGELIKAKEAADSASRAKSAFLANMSHEIRTPLGAVLGYSELLVQRLGTADIKGFGEAIKRNGRLLLNIINDILDLSKVEAGKIEIDKADIELSDYLNEIAALLNLQAREKGLDFKIMSQGRIPKVIHTDPLRLKQILFNIVGNAIKFTKKGHVAIVVKEIYDGSNAKLAFVISDSGLGISAEGAARLFQPFSQVDTSSTRAYGGTGLGLALAKRLAQELGGDVELTRTEIGHGSTFTLTIEAESETRVLFDNKPHAMPQPEEPSSRPSLAGLRILLVEDLEDNQNIIRFHLEAVGATVDVANNGREGVNKALENKYDRIIMDLQMPVMDGLGATAELRGRGIDIPIIALSAHAMEEERRHCLASGFNDHVSKPVDPFRLISALV